MSLKVPLTDGPDYLTQVQVESHGVRYRTAVLLNRCLGINGGGLSAKDWVRELGRRRHVKMAFLGNSLAGRG